MIPRPGTHTVRTAPVVSRAPYVVPMVTGSGTWARAMLSTQAPANTGAPAPVPSSVAAVSQAIIDREAAWTAKVRAREEAWTVKQRAREEAWARGDRTPKRGFFKRLRKSVTLKGTLRLAAKVNPQFAGTALATKSVSVRELGSHYYEAGKRGLAILGAKQGFGASPSDAEVAGFGGSGSGGDWLNGLLDGLMPRGGGGGGAGYSEAATGGALEGEGGTSQLPGGLLLAGGVVALAWLLLRD